MDPTTAPTGYGLVNESKSITDADLVTMAGALEKQLVRDFCPAYNVPALPVRCFGAEEVLPDGFWYLHFVDNVADADALGYHTDEDGVVYADVEMAVILKYGCGILSTPAGNESPDTVSSVASHELLEMTFDPLVNLSWPFGDGTLMAAEVADPCQGNLYVIDGVVVSDFVLPAFTQINEPASSRFDFLGALAKPMVAGDGGYFVLTDASGASKQVYGARPPSPLRQHLNRRKNMRLSRSSLSTPKPPVTP